MNRLDLPIAFGLVGTSEPGNIGAAARSLAAFGFQRLVLIAPLRKAAAKDRTLAVRIGRDVLRTAESWSLEEFPERVREFDEVWGTSAREGKRRRPESARTLVRDYLAQEAKRVLLLFGSERDGLSLDWLDHCHRLLRLPTREGAPLNLAHAVTVCAYEFGLQAAEAVITPARAGPGEPAGRIPGDVLSVSLRDRQELLGRAEGILAALGYPSRALHGHPPSAYLQPLRSAEFSQGQARWLLGLMTRLERRLGGAPERSWASSPSEQSSPGPPPPEPSSSEDPAPGLGGSAFLL